ncbi:MAG: ferritin-like domain-containing protein [Planctomycetes bacterium]|nr:ferritin-like domain-containing protein [Planctomycetota bacterium]
MTIPVQLGALAFDRGGHLLVKRALRSIPPGSSVEVCGTDPRLEVHLGGWCRAQGHGVARSASDATPAWVVRREDADVGRWQGATRAGSPDPDVAGSVVDAPPRSWGLAARGATVEAGGPEFDFALCHKAEVWADEARRLYQQAVSAQWDPESAIDWREPFQLPEEVEDAVVQVMTYLIENETAALLVPAGFAAKLHPHFKEVLQLLAVQAADEARHIEVFTRRATLRRDRLGLSTVGGQASLKTLVDEPDFALASFLLSVLGEGTFLSLLRFLEVHAPDPLTRRIMHLTARDEARHVAFGMAHLRRHVDQDPGLLGRLAESVHRRHAALRHTAGLNEEVFDALILLAAGSYRPEALERGFDLVVELQQEMDSSRQRRLVGIGFVAAEAAALSALHTRNFM